MIETNRLRLFPASQDQMQAMIDAEGDIGLRAAYQEMLDGCLEQPDQWAWYAMWMIEMKDGKHIGDYCFKGPPVNGAVELGYGINDAHRGQGYAMEAVHAAVAWALNQGGCKFRGGRSGIRQSCFQARPRKMRFPFVGYHWRRRTAVLQKSGEINRYL